MKRLFALMAVIALALPLAGSAAAQGSSGRPENPQIGLNFIRFFFEAPGQPIGTLNFDTPYLQPDAIFADFRALDIHAYRQLVKADLMWNTIEPRDDEWHFEAADAVLFNSPDLEPIVTLFAMQYASATPPWIHDPAQFEQTLGPEAQEYLETVVTRYADVVRYWEIGNEMDHWRVVDPGEEAPADLGNDARPPAAAPPDGFSPQEQGVFLAQVAEFIRQRDPDAVIVMPGMGGLSDYTLNTWFAGVIEGGGADWFDVVNYHYYGPWEPYVRARVGLTQFLQVHGLADRPVWMTETGSSASPTLTIRTDYPNSPASQAADIFRRIIPAYGQGDALAIWHTYIGSDNVPTNAWRLYGILEDEAVRQPSYYALRLLIAELIPFARVEAVSVDPRGVNLYRVTTAAGTVKYVAWGRGTLTLPDGVTELVSVLPAADGSYTWQAVAPGATVELSAMPVLMR